MSLNILKSIFSAHSINKGICIQFLRALSTSRSRHGPVGFIGLGNMGGHMANNLLKAGHSLVVFDVSAEAVGTAVSAGAVAGATPAAVAEQCSELVTMLPASPHVREVYCGAGGVLQGVRKGSLLLDCSTIDPSVSIAMASEARARGATYMDAPVSGGVLGARDATLTFMLGGTEADVPRGQAILDLMGKNVVHCGATGTGQAAKICNNLLLAISMAGTSEVINLAVNLGLDPAMMTKILNMSSGRCWSSEVYNPCPGVLPGVPASNNYNGGFGVSLMAKDLGLAQNAATETKSATPLGSLAHQIYRLMSNNDEFANKDFSSVYKFLQQSQAKLS